MLVIFGSIVLGGYWFFGGQNSLQLTEIKVLAADGKEIKKIKLGFKVYEPPINQIGQKISTAGKREPWWKNKEVTGMASMAPYEDVIQFLTKATIEAGHLNKESYQQILNLRKQEREQKKEPVATYYSMGIVEIDDELFGIVVLNIFKIRTLYEPNFPSDSVAYYKIENGVWKSDLPKSQGNLLVELPFRDPSLIQEIIKSKSLRIKKDGAVSTLER